VAKRRSRTPSTPAAISGATVDAEGLHLPSDTGATWVQERNQNALLQIDQIHHRVVRAQRRRVPRDQPCELIRGGQMSVPEQRVDSALRTTQALPGATHPGTVRNRRR